MKPTPTNPDYQLTACFPLVKINAVSARAKRNDPFQLDGVLLYPRQMQSIVRRLQIAGLTISNVGILA